MSKGEIVRRSIAAAIATAGAASAWWRLLDFGAFAYRIVPSVLLVAAAFVLGTAGGKKVARGIGVVLAMVGTLAAALVFAAVTLPDSLGQTTPEAVLTGVTRGLGILLHSPVPAPVDSETVSAAIIFTGYACGISCLLFCTRLPALGLIPPFLLFLGATMLSQGSVEPAAPTAAALVATSLIALALVPSGGSRGAISDGAEFAEPQRGPRQGRVLHGITAVALSALIAWLASTGGEAAGLTDEREPFDPHQQKSYMPQTDIDPIMQVNTWQTTKRALKDPVLSVAGAELPRALQWAVAESYTGVEWQTLKSYDNTDGPIPYAGPAETMTRVFGGTIATTGFLPGPWLPTAARATEVTGTAIRANAAAAVIARDDSAQNVGYQQTSTVLALPSLSVLDTTKPADAGETVDKQLPPTFPSALQEFADATTRGADSSYDKLRLLSKRLSSIPYSKTTTSQRHDPLGYAAITELVLSSHKGTQAQYATAFALLARSQGFSSRLVAGFATEAEKANAAAAAAAAAQAAADAAASAAAAAGGTASPSAPAPAPVPTSTVTTRQAIVWPEVNLTKVGWVPFAPGPGDLATGIPVPVPYTPPPAPPPPPPAPPPPPPAPEPVPEPEGGVPVVVVAAVLLVLLAGGWVGLVAVIRTRLRRRLRGVVAAPGGADAGGADSGGSAVPPPSEATPTAVGVSPASGGAATPGQAVIGAWVWVRTVDRHVQAAVPESPRAVIASGEPTDLVALAAAAETALYSPDPVEPQVAERAWTAADVHVASALGEAGWRGRVRWWLVPLLRVPGQRRARQGRTPGPS